MFQSVVAISIGAAAGALLRWLLAIQFNALVTAIPLGTLAANLVGGYLIGIAVAVFAQNPSIPPQWRLFIITVFLGGLTTFSTFSAKVVGHLIDGRITWSLGVIGVHVIGSVATTLLGIGTVMLLRPAL